VNPPLARFHLSIQVRFADTDAQGHTFFGSYFTYMDEAFMAYLAELGFPWSALADKGLGVFYVDSGCQFKGPSFFGDRLNVHAAITHLGNSSLTAEMTMIRDADRRLVATGHIKAVLVDARTEKASRLPDDLRSAVDEYQNVRESKTPEV
jgi:acyl-CoA thioester hydrolase